MVDRATPGRLGAAAALVLNAFVWGLSWWPLRALQAQGLHPLWATCFVYLFSLAALLLFRPGVLRECAGHASLLLLAAVAGLTNVGFNWAVTTGDVVRVVLLFYLMPAWSILLAWPLLGERPTATALARLLLALGGVVVVLHDGSSPWPVPQSAADWLGLGAGLCFALTNLLLLRLEQVPPAARILAMFVGGLLMAGATAGAGMALGGIAPPVLAWAALPMAGLLGLAFLVGNVGLQYGASPLPAQATALIMLSGVVFASASSVALGAADFTPRIAAGGALILAAAAWSAWPSRRRGASSPG